jgi:SAM-dependent methyltransferase
MIPEFFCEAVGVHVMHERAAPGLHEFVAEAVIPRYAKRPGRCVDLGAGAGAMSARLDQAGWDVVAVDRDVEDFMVDVPIERADLDDGGLADRLGGFDLVVAIEVIEHVERPIGLFREIGRLLGDTGVAVVTTPNVDSAVARVKFLLTDRLRMMDRQGDPTHISPIFVDLLPRYLAAADLRMVAHHTFPAGHALSRHWIGALARLLAAVLPGSANVGDNHVLVLARMPGRTAEPSA